MNKIEVKRSPVFEDDRGIFFPISITPPWIQSNISISSKYTFRGLHHQRGKTAQSKLVSVIKGEILDFVVSLRMGSFGDVQFFRLAPGDQILIPAGYAHGFLALQEDTMIQYLVDNNYSQSTEISFDWKSVEIVKELMLSETNIESMHFSPKDAAGVSLTTLYAETDETLPNRKQ